MSHAVLKCQRKSPLFTFFYQQMSKKEVEVGNQTSLGKFILESFFEIKDLCLVKEYLKDWSCFWIRIQWEFIYCTSVKLC